MLWLENGILYKIWPPDMQGIKWNFYCFTYALQQEMDAGLRYKLNIQIYCYVVIAIS